MRAFDDRPLWVFAYGSLMWDPGFAPVEMRHARLPGWRRSFCMWSWHYRGTDGNFTDYLIYEVRVI